MAVRAEMKPLSGHDLLPPAGIVTNPFQHLLFLNSNHQVHLKSERSGQIVKRREWKFLQIQDCISH